MYELIVACDPNYGIGIDNRLPWHCPEELKLFKTITTDSVLVVGRRTAESLPKLSKRTVVCLTTNTKKPLLKDENNCELINDFRNVNASNKRVIIAGGAVTYKTLSSHVDKIHLSMFKSSYACDTFFEPSILDDFTLDNEQDYGEFVYKVYVREYHGEHSYLSLLRKTISSSRRQGRNGTTFSTFGEHLSFDLRKGFPLLTTKKMFFRGVVEELLFFVRGQTDSSLLEEKGVNIWKYNSDRKFLDSIGMKDRKEGVLGPLYGYNWRHFGAPYDEEFACPMAQGFDQLAYVVETIRKDPHSRRILLTDYNPAQASQGVLYPCHSLMIQFYVDKGELDMFCYNRSQDLFLGTPFNIASSALLLTLIAQITNLKPRWLKMSLGDVHVYEQHLEAVQTQLQRVPYKFPLLVLPEMKELKDIENMSFDQFVLVNYKSYPTIKAEMVA